MCYQNNIFKHFIISWLAIGLLSLGLAVQAEDRDGVPDFGLGLEELTEDDIAKNEGPELSSEEVDALLSAPNSFGESSAIEPPGNNSDDKAVSSHLITGMWIYFGPQCKGGICPITKKKDCCCVIFYVRLDSIWHRVNCRYIGLFIDMAHLFNIPVWLQGHRTYW